jgi:rSAM/selenodomain-associated transferase 2
MQTPKISIIIPVLDEAATIEETLTKVASTQDIEVIIVDGGSRDKTLKITEIISKQLAPFLPIKIITSQAGRAHQMNTGAAIAKGDILLFLHADTLLPPDFDILLLKALQNATTVAGAFKLQINAQLPGLRLVEKMVNMRSHFFSMPYGDQAIFLKASIFDEIGGFPDLPIMEDFELMLSLKKLGKIAIIPAPVITSGRRWQKLGVVKTTMLNQVIIAGYLIGIPPHLLVQWYRQGGFKHSK